MPKKQPSQAFPLIVAAAVVAGAYYAQQQGWLSGISTTPSVSTIAPSQELQALVAPIKELAKGKENAPKLGHWYRDAASVVRDDSKFITSTEQARAWLVHFDSLSIQGTPVAGSIPGFGAAKDKVLEQAIGLEPKTVDAETRKKLADTLDAIGWALGG